MAGCFAHRELDLAVRECEQRVVLADAHVLARVTVEFPVALVVDGSKVTIAAADLAKISVKGEVVDDEAKGPKIRIQKFKNKTGVARPRQPVRLSPRLCARRPHFTPRIMCENPT